jgi:hypothetical protein
MNRSQIDDLVNLMRMEYLEMPDLKLTMPQARRLWDAPVDLCEQAMGVLVQAGFLVKSRDGAFLRRGDAFESTVPMARLV